MTRQKLRRFTYTLLQNSIIFKFFVQLSALQNKTTFRFSSRLWFVSSDF